jgi:hypothetical protein
VAIAQATGLAISEVEGFANEQLQGLQGGLWGEQAMGEGDRPDSGGWRTINS